MRASKKCLNATFLTDCENLWAFIRSDAHAVRAGIKLKGQPPLNNPGVYRQTEVDGIPPAFFVSIHHTSIKLLVKRGRPEGHAAHVNIEFKHAPVILC